MSDTNPQIEENLNRLTELCCDILEGKRSVEDDATPVLRALLMSGHARSESQSLQAEIEARVKESCRDDALHRGGELTAITSKLQKQFEDLIRWESRQPDEHLDPKAANISAATNS